MNIRPYNAHLDREAVHRIWREVGWSDGTPAQEEATDLAFSGSRALVAEMEGAPECAVLTMPATLRYLDEDLPITVVKNVATGHVGRKQGLAGRTVVHSLIRDVGEGALVAALGMFEQGYYNRLGFGTGSYDRWVSFDPATLHLPRGPRPPRRIADRDWPQAHACRLQRRRGHGAVSIIPPEATGTEMLGARNGVGLGYYDGPGGTLSHYVWMGAANLANGPYFVRWLAYQTNEQLLDLLALLKALGDQVRLVGMIEPRGIQLQSMLLKPFKQRQLTEKGDYPAGVRGMAWWQMRICNLPGCLARTHLPGKAVRFNLRLSDPLTAHTGPHAHWRGVEGDYVVTLGPSSGAEKGADPALPTLSATVNAFTRLWLGVSPATGLAVTDGLQAGPELLAQLDALLTIPQPLPDWAF